MPRQKRRDRPAPAILTGGAAAPLAISGGRIRLEGSPKSNRPKTVKMHSSLCVATLILAGCATAPAPRQMRFDSDPPGARVFYGAGASQAAADLREYVGTAPCQWTPPQDAKGRFKAKGVAFYSSAVRPFIVFRADWTNGASRVLVFRAGAAFQAQDDIPASLLFTPTNSPPKP